LDAKDPGYDPVKLAIEEAHQYGLKFYAYINLLLPTFYSLTQPQPFGAKRLPRKKE